MLEYNKIEESERTIELYGNKMEEMSVISDITELNKMSFEVIEKFNNKKKVKYLSKGLSIEKFNEILDGRVEERKYTKEKKRECYNQIKKYCDKLLKNNLRLKQMYVQSDCNRYYTKGQMSLQYLPNEIRGFLCEGEMTDIDIRNGQPTIIYWLCKINDIECSYLEKYVKERESILERSGLNKMDFIISMNTKKVIYNKKDEFYRMFDKEMKMIQKNLMNKLLVDKEYKEILEKMEMEKKEINLEGCFLNRVYFKHECDIIMYLRSILIESNYEISSYNYDGIMIYGDYYNVKELEKRLTEETRKQFELPEEFKLVFKRHNNMIEIPEDWVDEEDSEKVNKEYEKWIEEFERTHCKIINKGSYIKKIYNNENVLIENLVLTEAQLKINYKHISVGEGKYKKICINEWISGNNNIKCYDEMDIYPNEEECPKNIYNLWIPFLLEQNKNNYEYKGDILEFFLNHIKILCNNNENIYDYIIKWIGQMIQNPEKKSGICPIFYSKEGAGKGSLLLLLISLLGIKKVFESSNPSRDVWGNFNSTMKDSYFVCLDELKQSSMNEKDGELKNLITEEYIEINDKQKSLIRLKSYHRFMVFLNKSEDIPKINKGNRRFIIINSSNELCGKKEYFDKFRIYLKDNDGLMTLYNYLKSLKDVNSIIGKPPIETELNKKLENNNKSLIEEFIESVTIETISNDEVIYTNTELYNKFVDWMKEMEIEYKINNVNFKKKLNLIIIEEGIINYTEKNIKYVKFNNKILINYFNLDKPK
jgi:hypothetical protein